MRTLLLIVSFFGRHCCIRQRVPVTATLIVAGGHVQVQFTTASPTWLARKVLEYGTHAEVLDPDRYRQAILRAIA